MQRLTQARALHEDMAQFAQRHKAQDAQVTQGDATAGIKAQNEAVKGGAKSTSNPSPEMTRPDLVLASAAGIALTATDSMHLANQSDHVITAGRDVSIASGRSWLASVRGVISFVAGLGIRLFAAKGKVEIQAQGDAMALAALKDLTISSTDGKIIITAKDEVWLGAGGSYIRINASGIVNGTTGQILEKCAKWSKTGPDSTLRPLASFKPDYQAQYILTNAKSGLPMVRHPYQLKLPDGRTMSGITTDQGETLPIFTAASQPVQLQPGVIGTVFFRSGSTLEVRKGILACFDRFAELFGEYLKGGRGPEGTGNFGRRMRPGVEAIRRVIVETPPYEAVEAVRSSEADPDAAPAYQIGALTSQALAEDYRLPGSSFVVKKGTDGGMSSLKFWMPMDFVNTPEGVQQYEAFLRFVCGQLPVCGGYGGLSPILPYNMHPYLSQEGVMAQRFRGLEIDSYWFVQGSEYLVSSYEGESVERGTKFYDDLHPGAKIDSYGFIKGVNWYTLIGDLFVDRLGGEATVRTELARPDINIERIGKCLLIRAGDFPWLGAPEEAWSEPYLVVNNVLRVLRNPDPQALQTNVPGAPHADRDGTRKWEGRFDYRDAPSLPCTPRIVPAKTITQ